MKPERTLHLVLAAMLGAPTAAGDPAEPLLLDSTRPDVATLEDIYGPTGDRFQAGLGLFTFEKAFAGDPDPITGYGIGVDDAVFTWKEVNLVEDLTECAPGAGGQTGGSCAAVELETTNFYEGRSRLNISVLESSPTVNNCNDDFVCEGGAVACDPFATVTGCAVGVACVPDYGDAVDDMDCDDDGVADVRVEVESDAELAPGEYLTLSCTEPVGPGCPAGIYRGAMPISVAYDVAGVLFLVPSGGGLPTVRVTYRDNDDGTGAPCSNDVDPAARGLVEAATAVLIDTGQVTVNVVQVVGDDGDGDGFADTGETVTLAISVINRTGVTLTGVTARLATDDDKIDCVLDGTASFGELAPAEEKLSETTGDNFVFRVSDLADRGTAGLTDLDEYAASFSVTVAADQFDASSLPLGFVLDLDLDAVGGGAPDGGYFESFEVSSGLASFTTMNLDFGFQTGDPFANSDGYRCQYSDPDWIRSNSYSQITDCHVGPTGDEVGTDSYFWQVHRTSDIDGGRAYSGTRSLYMGIFGAAADEHTTPVSVLEAIRMAEPVNLTVTGNPVLSIVHQVSLMDGRTVGASPGQAGDRGAVQLQLADADGTPVGHWIKLEPYKNVYDKQAEDNYSNCMFDPTDDGSTEDEFFDPSDPDRRLGPSTLCFPEWNFVHVGNTFDPFNGDVGMRLGIRDGGITPEGPALEGSLGLGSWIESRFNLQRYRGRRVRIRFVNSSIKIGSFVTWESLFANNPSPGDDGWWIDDVRIDGTLDAPPTIVVDGDPPPGTPTCASAGCGVVDAMLSASPSPPLPAPGLAVILSAAGSTVDACPDGTLQYRFRDVFGDVLRDYTDNPVLPVAPTASTTYAVDVRCSSDPACDGSAELALVVECPRSGNLPAPTFTDPILLDRAGDLVTVVWATPADVDLVAGPLDGYPSVTVVGSALASTSLQLTVEDPAAYLLVRERGEFCNSGGSWNTAGGAQQGDRDLLLP